jgi:molybdopterin-containing oxidoreductase family membrane subunit
MKSNGIYDFIKDGLLYSMRGRKAYHIWMGSLTFIMLLGAYFYNIQLNEGLVVTGMNDYVSWGLYISNLTFLVGLAAAAVMLVLPAYIFQNQDFEKATLIGEGVAVAALIMCIAFVTVDLGSPERIWHLLPVVGYLNIPSSMLAWDVIVMNGYLALNIYIPFYILYSHYKGVAANKKKYLPFVLISIFWAFSIHLVTAFLLAGLPAKPYWNSSLLGPRFLASAFSAGPAFILILLSSIDKYTDFKIQKSTFSKLALIVTVAAQINLVMLFSEVFKEFYQPTEHSRSARYLFFGIGEYNNLVGWIWMSISMNILATVLLTIHKIRENQKFLNRLCILLFIAVWMEKGIGLVIPGFIPTSLGDYIEYLPSKVEIFVTLGIWAMGLFILTILVRVALAIELGYIGNKKFSLK